MVHVFLQAVFNVRVVLVVVIFKGFQKRISPILNIHYNLYSMEPGVGVGDISMI